VPVLTVPESRRATRSEEHHDERLPHKLNEMLTLAISDNIYNTPDNSRKSTTTVKTMAHQKSTAEMNRQQMIAAQR